ncbi:MAG: HNH endonuclease, partial [Actinomycetota bacterium]
FTSRLIPPRVRRALERQDGWCCSFPSCGARAHLHAHHIVPWPLGPTDLENLTLVCPFHHKLVHEGGWHVTMHDGMPDWFRPDWTPHIPRPGPVAAAG